MSQFVPTLVVYTTWFNGDPICRLYGAALYSHLTRPHGSPLGWGPGVPVYVGVSPDEIDKIVAPVNGSTGSSPENPCALLPVVVVLLDSDTYDDPVGRSHAVESIERWHRHLPPGCLLLVRLDDRWQRVETRLPCKTHGGAISCHDDSARSVQRFIEETTLELCRLLVQNSPPSASAIAANKPAMPSMHGQRVSIYISRDRHNPEIAGAMVESIVDYIRQDFTAKAFFDEAALTSVENEHRGEMFPQNTLLVSVRSSNCAFDPICQRELAEAKRQRLPILAVLCLQGQEQRSPPYGGNVPTVCWRPEDGAGPVVSHAMRVWLQHLHFRVEAPRLVRLAGLRLEPIISSRPPELLDISLGTVPESRASLVLHPDPALSVDEQRILRQVAPRLSLTTPTGLFRRVLGDGSTVDAVLEDLSVAMSLSSSPDEGGPEGITSEHVRDATIHLARSLFGTGASITYGGDLRKNSYTRLLAELIESHNRSGARPGKLLRWFRAAHVLDDDSDMPPIHTRWIRQDQPDSIFHGWQLDPVTPTPIGTALFYTDMRRAMAQECDARVCLGGKCLPPGMTDDGYAGRFPGQLEDAWFMYQQGKPVYVVGGFGGGARLLGQILRSGNNRDKTDIPPELREAHVRGCSPQFDAFCREFDELRRDKPLSLPGDLEAMFHDLAVVGARILADDSTAMAHNGLTVGENEQLFRSRHPAEIAALVLTGLCRMRRSQVQRPLRVRLLRSALTSAPDVQCYVVGVLRHQPVSQTLADLDKASGGALTRATDAMKDGDAYVMSLDPDRFPAPWLMAVSIGSVASLAPGGMVGKKVRAAARSMVIEANRLGLRSLAMLPIGAGLGLRMDSCLEAIVDGVLEGQQHGGSLERLILCEHHPARYAALAAAADDLEPGALLNLDVLSPAASLPSLNLPSPSYLHVQRQGDALQLLFVPPTGNAAVSSMRVDYPDADIRKLITLSGRRPPSPALVSAEGAKLSQRLLGSEMRKSLEALIATPLVVVHDPESGNIPFELLSVGDRYPVAEGGMSRRVALLNHGYEAAMTQRPRAGRLRVLFILNPTGDLLGAEDEGYLLQEALEALQPAVDITKVNGDAILPEERASRARVRELLCSEQFDVVHYAGHAQFEPGVQATSGLVCAGGELLTADDLKDLTRPPALVFFNACESSRVRADEEEGEFDNETPAQVASGLAEQFLRAGVGHFLGSFWQVGDQAAACFATRVYAMLLDGETIGDAVLAGRTELKQRGLGHWFNYVLYGAADFRLVMGVG